MVNLEDLKETVEENTNSQTSSGKTNVRLDNEPVNKLKQVVGVSQNTQLAPLVESLIYEELGDSEKAEAKESEFVNQFEQE